MVIFSWSMRMNERQLLSNQIEKRQSSIKSSQLSANGILDLWMLVHWWDARNQRHALGDLFARCRRGELLAIKFFSWLHT